MATRPEGRACRLPGMADRDRFASGRHDARLRCLRARGCCRNDRHRHAGIRPWRNRHARHHGQPDPGHVPARAVGSGRDRRDALYFPHRRRPRRHRRQGVAAARFRGLQYRLPATASCLAPCRRARRRRLHRHGRESRCRFRGRSRGLFMGRHRARGQAPRIATGQGDRSVRQVRATWLPPSPPRRSAPATGRRSARPGRSTRRGLHARPPAPAPSPRSGRRGQWSRAGGRS